MTKKDFYNNFNSILILVYKKLKMSEQDVVIFEIFFLYNHVLKNNSINIEYIKSKSNVSKDDIIFTLKNFLDLKYYLLVRIDGHLMISFDNLYKIIINNYEDDIKDIFNIEKNNSIKDKSKYTKEIEKLKTIDRVKWF